MNPVETKRGTVAHLEDGRPGSTGPGSSNVSPLRSGRIVLLAVGAVAAFHLGFLYAPLCWLVLVGLGCLFALRRTACGRGAFYTGLAVGLGLYGPQLYFFWNLFGPAAIALWLVLAFWLALFLLLLHGVDRYWGTPWAVALAPVLWLGIEFFRSELYYLRFSWLTAGSLLPPEVSGPLLGSLGIYGLGALLVLTSAWLVGCVEARRAPRWRTLAAVAGLGAAYTLWAVVLPALAISPPIRLPVAGVQLEFPKPAEVLEALDHAQAMEPRETSAPPILYLLSEYTFDGPVPDEVRAWCLEQQCWLVAGGKQALDGGRFHNTAFVVSTNGEVVFRQAKTVPIQFFNDGVPAPEQRVWESPWGRIGLCICYDLSYTRVVDRLIRQGAQALLVPAMDPEPWGEHQHRLNARMTRIRSAEHRVPIFRVASSGFSQLTAQDGSLLAEAPFPGQGEVLRGYLAWTKHGAGTLPLDRSLAPLAVLATLAILLALGREQHRARSIGGSGTKDQGPGTCDERPLTTDH